MMSTELSSAARSVVDSYHNSVARNSTDIQVIADALRCAVHQLNEKRWENGVNWSRMKLLAIADELETW